MRNLVLVAALAVGLAACASPADPTPGASSTTASGFTVTSSDFADGDELADWATAAAFGGQCKGDNLNPALGWADAPAGTASYAIVLIDRSAGDFIHWVHFDIPGTVTSVARGGSAELPGVDGATNPSPGYFGPCPPGPDHRYEFTVYALDAPLGLAAGADFAAVSEAIAAHELAEASIAGMRSGPA
jgi:Raf kinase inhibitor-like YbhB/YbcL family protein